MFIVVILVDVGMVFQGYFNLYYVDSPIFIFKIWLPKYKKAILYLVEKQGCVY